MRRILPILFAAVLLGAFLLPHQALASGRTVCDATASASRESSDVRSLRADDGYGPVYVQRPRSVSRRIFRVAAECVYYDSNGKPGQRTVRFIGRKLRTVFRFQDVNAGSPERQVTYRWVMRFMKTHPAVSADVKYVWKKTPNGRRYRYAKEIFLAYGAEG